ncbi:MAG: flagellar export chaperone FliS [Magnetococcales bacterium]|nr:flagellar export chaperone FliS [Magnetococcales bacterium]MBF0321814.1 flagellar export chaperone FliS [Magnetococcales bacterium]
MELQIAESCGTSRSEEVSKLLEMSPLEMVVRLYEGAIGYIEDAQDALEAEEIEDFKRNLDRGRRIIEELKRTLNFKDGGQLSAQLNDLYAFVLDSLKQAELTHRVTYLERVISPLETLLDGWRGAARSVLAS